MTFHWLPRKAFFWLPNMARLANKRSKCSKERCGACSAPPPRAAARLVGERMASRTALLATGQSLGQLEAASDSWRSAGLAPLIPDMPRLVGPPIFVATLQAAAATGGAMGELLSRGAARSNLGPGCQSRGRTV